MKQYKLILAILVALIALGSNAQKKISDKNSTYQNVNYENLHRKINWTIEPKTALIFRDSKPEDLKTTVSLFFDKTVSSEFAEIDLFNLDTISTEFGSFPLYANPKYFDSLKLVDLSMASKGKFYLGRLTENVSMKNKSLKELSNILIETGAIRTYNHLNAEMIHKVKEKSRDKFVIKYNVIWHMCTSDCFHPKYKFTFTVDKRTRRMWLKRL